MAHQQGSVYFQAGTWYLKYRTTEFKNGNPQRVHKTVRLCSRNGKQHHPLCSFPGEHRTQKSVFDLRNLIMRQVNQENANQTHQQDLSIADFWEQRYLPYCEEVLPLTGLPRKKPSTVRGYKQIWSQHLKAHFGDLTLQQYEAYMGTQFLQSLTSKQGKTTLKHIKALGSSLFRRAVVEQRIKTNPWHDVQMPDDAIEPGDTKHYTLDEAENIISVLVDHVDCQLIMALSCFLGLRPGEIAALRWEDFDSENVHIRRSVVLGVVGTPKTAESIASLPLIDQVLVPFELWRRKCMAQGHDCKNGWVFENRNGDPVDLHNVVNRVIKPILSAKGIVWKSLYAGRRGACTAVVEATNGNYAVAQALLRHRSMKTTLDVYKKAITPESFRNGMKLLEQKAKNGTEKEPKMLEIQKDN